MPIFHLRAKLAMAGRSKAEMLSAVKAAYEKKQLPELESGAMDFADVEIVGLADRTKASTLMPHLMFDTLVKRMVRIGVPVRRARRSCPAPIGSCLTSQQDQTKGLPPILVFLVGVGTWSR